MRIRPVSLLFRCVSTRKFHRASGRAMENRHVVLASRPGVSNAPRPENFACVPCDPVESSQLTEGQVLLKTCYLSVDPAQRCQMNESTGADYVPPWGLAERIVGFAGVGSVVHSRHPAYSAGDLLFGTPSFPWCEYFVEDMQQSADNYTKLDKLSSETRPTLGLSLLGIPGLTAFFGLQEFGHIKQGQTMVVSGAAGSCGSVAGQVARLMGCSRVVGICGTDEKCDWLTEGLGFDHAVNYRTEDVGKEVQAACPSGVDVYFDNVGGPVSDAVIEQMKDNSHIVLCGQIALYNQDTPHVPPLPDHTDQIVKARNITREEYVVLDYVDKYPEALEQLMKWYEDCHIKIHETVEKGLENTGKAFCAMMAGDNLGKQIIHVGDP